MMIDFSHLCFLLLLDLDHITKHSSDIKAYTTPKAIMEVANCLIFARDFSRATVELREFLSINIFSIESQ